MDFPPYKKKKRTIPQNSALHVFCELVANDMTAAGYTMSVIMKFPFKIYPTPTMVKDMIRTIATAQTGKDSTAKLTTKELQDAAEEFNRWMGEELYLHVPWPSKIIKD